MGDGREVGGREVDDGQWSGSEVGKLSQGVHEVSNF